MASNSVISSQNNMITVSVKLMNGDILLIEYDQTMSISGLKHKIQEFDEQFSEDQQVLTRLSDEQINPADIYDGDSFILVINPENIYFRFYDESLVEPVRIIPQEGSANENHRFHIYSLYVHSNSYYFIYDIDSNQYAIADSCDREDEDDDELETYYFTEDTIWYSSLYECLDSYYEDIFPEEHPVIDELEVRFKKFRLNTEFEIIQHYDSFQSD